MQSLCRILLDGYRYTLDSGLHKGVITPGQGIESHMTFTLTKTPTRMMTKRPPPKPLKPI